MKTIRKRIRLGARKAPGSNDTDILSEIVSEADLIQVDGAHFLLAPVTNRLIDRLAAVGAVTEDMEEDDPLEAFVA